MSHASQSHHGFYYLLLALANIQCRHAIDLQFARHEHDAVLAAVAEELRMLKVDARSDKEVYELFKSRRLQSIKRGEETDFCRRDDVAQNLL